MNLFRVLRDPVQSKKLVDMIRLTPYARDEFDFAYEDCEDSIERARRTIIRSHFAFSSQGLRKHKTGFRNESMRCNSDEWRDFPPHLLDIVDRLMGVVIENSPAVELIKKFDHEETLFYLDPPYLPSTRVSGGYECEMSEDDHIELLELISGVRGKVVISGYDNDLYDAYLLPIGYQKRSKKARAQSGNYGTKIAEEVLWISPNSMEHGLFYIGDSA